MHSDSNIPAEKKKPFKESYQLWYLIYACAFVFIGQQPRLLGAMAYRPGGGGGVEEQFISSIADDNQRGCVYLVRAATDAHTSSSTYVRVG